MTNYDVSDCSAKDAGLVKKARDLLSYHAFNTEPGKGVSQDYNKPLIIPAWSDSFEAISGGSGGAKAGGRQNLEMWKHQFTTHFPQSVSNVNISKMVGLIEMCQIM